MGPIRLLDKHVSELIAAGEVVERPASAVKELLENSIDAGAGAITLEIKNGGIGMIRITDNGSGIPAEEVETAFLRHATSKVFSEEDLSAIGTLGFRGEALASIAAVARVEVVTRTADELGGTRLRIEGGEVVSKGDAGCPAGTTLVVRDLFYNTPARMKFLKKDSTESAAVYAVAQRIALSHPEISLRFVRDGREEMHTPGDGKLLSAVHAVFGREFASGLIPVEYELHGVSVGGYITKPAAARASRSMQNFFINGRFVKSRTMMAALEEGCKNSVMVGKFPGCVLTLAMQAGLVDVNVHPAKTEVRFAGERDVFDAVYYAVKSSLAEHDTRKELVASASARPAPAGFAPDAAAPLPQLEFEVMKIAGAPREETDELRSSMPPVYEASPNPAGVQASPGFARQPARPEPPASVAFAVPPRAEPAPRPAPAQPQVTEYRILGEAFHTYILVESGGELLLVDKHAAHERILYEQLKASGKSCGQLLLNPVRVSLSPVEKELLLQNAGLLLNAGFQVEDFGTGTVLVREAPMLLAGGENAVAAAVQEVAEYLAQGRKSPEPERIEWLYHSVACRSAVKAGDRTSPMEVERIVGRVMEFGDIRYCPHGRPVAVVLSQKEIEKRFGRA